SRLSAFLAGPAHHETILQPGEVQDIAVPEDLAGDAPAVDVHAVAAVQVLDDGVHRADQDDGVVAADEVGLDLQIVVGSASDAGPAAEHVHDLAPVLAADQEARRALGDRLGRPGGVIALGERAGDLARYFARYFARCFAQDLARRRAALWRGAGGRLRRRM